jgi:hypothetical protein
VRHTRLNMTFPDGDLSCAICHDPKTAGEIVALFRRSDWKWDMACVDCAHDIFTEAARGFALSADA